MGYGPEDSALPDAVDHVHWSELEEVAPNLFTVWVGHPEVAWARQAWKALRRANLTSYRDELEKQRVLIRFMALAVIYIEFCGQAWEETVEPRVGDWASDLRLSPFRIVQIVGEDFVAEWYVDDNDMLRHAAEMLIVEERPRVIRALVAYYGDLQELFVVLMGSSDPAKSGKRPGPKARSRILNDPNGVGLPAYEWVTAGLAPIWYPSEEW